MLVDVLAPRVELTSQGDYALLQTRDVVSAAPNLEYRARRDQGWSAWERLEVPETRLDGDVRAVEVRDEGGNVGSSELSLRGLPPPDAAEGCGCSTLPTSGRGLWPLFVLVLWFAGHGRRRAA